MRFAFVFICAAIFFSSEITSVESCNGFVQTNHHNNRYLDLTVKALGLSAVVLVNSIYSEPVVINDIIPEENINQ